MAHLASLEAHLVGSTDGDSRDGDRSHRQYLVIRVVFVTISVMGSLIAGFALLNPSHANAEEVSVLVNLAASSSIKATSNPIVCPVNWCTNHGFEEDACNCGICGSYGGCSWSCNVQNSKVSHRLRECNARTSTLRDGEVLAFGLICLVLIMVIAALLCKIYCWKSEMKDVGNTTSSQTRAVVVDAAPHERPNTVTIAPDTQIGDSTSEQSSKVSTSQQSDEASACKQSDKVFDEAEAGLPDHQWFLDCGGDKRSVCVQRCQGDTHDILMPPAVDRNDLVMTPQLAAIHTEIPPDGLLAIHVQHEDTRKQDECPSMFECSCVHR